MLKIEEEPIILADVTFLNFFIDFKKKQKKTDFTNVWSENIWQQTLLSESEYVWIFKKDDAVIAYVVLLDVMDVLEILHIEVLDSYKRKGLAQKLMFHLKERARQKSQKVWLELRADNFAALRFYENNNFKIVGKRPKYYSDKEQGVYVDALLMELNN